MMTYAQRDLGYPRAPTEALIAVKFPNGEVWDVPAQAVADSRDANYASEEEDTVGFIRDGELTDYDLIDWLKNNMDWEDVAPYAHKVQEPPPVNHEAAWGEAACEVRGAL